VGQQHGGSSSSSSGPHVNKALLLSQSHSSTKTKTKRTVQCVCGGRQWGKVRRGWGSRPEDGDSADNNCREAYRHLPPCWLTTWCGSHQDFQRTHSKSDISEVKRHSQTWRKKPRQVLCLINWDVRWVKEFRMKMIKNSRMLSKHVYYFQMACKALDTVKQIRI